MKKLSMTVTLDIADVPDECGTLDELPGTDDFTAQEVADQLCSTLHDGNPDLWAGSGMFLTVVGEPVIAEASWKDPTP